MSTNSMAKKTFVSLMLGGLLSTAMIAQTPSLLRGPYVQSTTTSSGVIAWGTNIVASPLAEVRYGFAPESLTCPGSGVCPVRGEAIMDAGAGLVRYAVTLTTLDVNTRYYYQVITNGIPLTQPSSNFTFKTFPQLDSEPAGNPSFSFTVIGDSGIGCPGTTNPEDPQDPQCQVATKMRQLYDDGISAPLRFLLHTGDVIYSCGDEIEGGGGGYSSKFFDPYQNLVRELPMWLSLGNHDYGTRERAGSDCTLPAHLGRPYLDNFFLPTNNPAGTERFYSFNYGNAHLVALDTELVLDATLDASGPGQQSWFENDLASTTNAAWKFVYFHIPAFSSGGGHSSRFDFDILDVRERISRRAQEQNVDLVIAGHEHAYELSWPLMVSRSDPRNRYDVSDNGVYYVVTGGGGAGLSPIDPEADNNWLTCYRGLDENFFHTTKVTIDNENLRLRLQPVDVHNQFPDGCVDTGTCSDPSCTLQMTKGMLTGIVTDQVTGDPIANAAVTMFIPDLLPAECPASNLANLTRERGVALTDSDGRFKLYLFTGTSGTTHRTYSMEVTATGYRAQVRCGVEVFPHMRQPTPQQHFALRRP